MPLSTSRQDHRQAGSGLPAQGTGSCRPEAGKEGPRVPGPQVPTSQLCRRRQGEEELLGGALSQAPSPPLLAAVSPVFALDSDVSRG